MGITNNSKTNYDLFDFNKLENMPAPRVKRCSGNSVARILLKCPQSISSTGEADLYVHIKCVEYAGGRGLDAKFNILLVDDDYDIVVPQQRSDGTWTGVTKNVSVQNVMKMAEVTKKYYEAHENNHVSERGIPDIVPFDVMQREDSQYSTYEY